MERVIANDSVRLDDMRPGETRDVVFRVDDPADYDRVVSVRAGCGCTRATYDSQTGQVRVSYEAQPVPEHLRGQGYYEPVKYLEVEFMGEDGMRTSQTVQFQVRISGR